jgi:uncharacterized protein (TIGR03435 family)
LAFTACLAFGQQFEVASIKPSPPPALNRISIRMGGGPGTPDPGRINYEYVTLRMVLVKAYEVRNSQISGPAWLDSERFDIAARVPDGTTKEQFAVMLQNLLIERFKLALHREKKDLPTYALVVGRNGPKFKASADAPGDADDARTQPEKPPQMMGRPVMGKDGFPEMPARGGRGGMMIMMPGRAKMVGNRMSMQELADRLSSQLDRPVTDMTGLNGKYDITLYYSPEGLATPMGGMPMGGMPMGGMPMPPPGAGPPPGALEGRGGGGFGGGPPDGETGPALFTAVQEQLGLKLEPRKAPLDLLVIDRLEKVPTDN